MKYYAKISGPYQKYGRVYAEVWQAEPLGDSFLDKRIFKKTFWTQYGAKKWSEKKIMKLVMENKMKYFFIKDEDVIRDTC
jgi:hypothetical protein